MANRRDGMKFFEFLNEVAEPGVQRNLFSMHVFLGDDLES